MTVEEWVKAAHEPLFIKHPNGIEDIKRNNTVGRMFYDLLCEEMHELLLAVLCADTYARIAIVDALGDIMWLCMTMLTCMDVDWRKVIERIAESNATKLLDGYVEPDKYGKIHKGAHYVPPKLDDLV